MEIRYLPDDPAVVRTVAEWHHGEWGHLTGRSVAEREAELLQQCGSDRIPLTLLAVEAEQPVGCASLVVSDMSTRPELTPWLASVYVLPTHRRGGVGGRLCRQAVAEARRLGVETLYLFTTDRVAFYRALGWQPGERVTYRGEEVTLMHLHPQAVAEGG